MTWDLRLRQNIYLTSPKMIPFAAKWRGNPRSVNKFLGVFKFPGVKGEYAQDLDVGAIHHSFTIYFDGPNHDLIAQGFFNSCREKGKWTVIHPVLYKLKLQLVKAEEQIQPVTDGNYTAINVEFMETLELYDILSGGALSNIAAIANVAFIAASVANFAASVFTESAAAISALRGTSDLLGKIADQTFGPVLSGAEDLYNELKNNKKKLDETNDPSKEYNPESSGQAMSDIYQTGYKNSQSPEITKQSTNTILTSSSELIPASNSYAAINQALTAEMALSNALSACAVNMSSNQYASRADAVDSAIYLQTKFYEITDMLDNVQEIFSEEMIDRKFTTLLGTYDQLNEVLINSISAIILNQKNLPPQIKRTLKTASTPAKTVALEFGSFGPNDQYLADFINYNNLVGEEILYLPAGREYIILGT